MNEQKEMPAVTNSPSPRFRYWFTPPESLKIKVADIEPFVPKSNWKIPAPAGMTVEIPAEKIFSKNVPRIPLRLLADLLPDHVSSSDGTVNLPVAKLAASYQLVQHVEELIPEIPPEPEKLPEPDIPVLPESAEKSEDSFDMLKVDAPAPIPSAAAATAPESAVSTEIQENDGRVKESDTGISARELDQTQAGKSAPHFQESRDRNGLREPDAPAPVVPKPAIPELAIPKPCAPELAIPKPPVLERPNFPAITDPAPNPPPLAIEPPKASAVELLNPATEEKKAASSKFPARRLGSFVGLPMFRRRAPAAVPPPIPPPLSADPVELPPAKHPREHVVPGLVLPEAPVPPPLPADELPAALTEPAAVAEPVPPPSLESPQAPGGSGEFVAAASWRFPEVPKRQEAAPAVNDSGVPPIEPEPSSPPPPAIPVRMLRTEHFPRESKGQEIVEQEPLQALFLTEEAMTVNRVIELCGGLPGINSCVLAHGSVVVASHNVPDGVDLVSMSAHASDMLKAMRDSSARMGVGTVPAVTLHTEKGVISFFNREDLTMLVFHKDRGFIPGVREKLAAVIGELTKARLTLPVGGDEDIESQK